MPVRYHAYDVRGAAPGTHRGLPSPSLTFVLPIGPALELEAPDGTRSLYRACLAGLHDAPERIVHDGVQTGIQLSVPPLAARALFGLPAAELAGVSVEAADVLGRVGDELVERVGTGATWAERFAALDDVLDRLRRAHDDGPRASDEVRHAWRRVLAGRSVRGTAQEIGWSEDHLSRRFRAEFGVRPKVAGRMARFDRARQDIAARALAGRLDLADVAAVHGFADQAHLAREFRALAGCSATRWVAEEVHGGLVGPAAAPEVGSVQDDDPGPAPGWAA